MDQALVTTFETAPGVAGVSLVSALVVGGVVVRVFVVTDGCGPLIP